MIENSDADHKFLFHEQLNKKKAYVHEVEKLFAKIEKDEHGIISNDAFRTFLKEDRDMLTFLASLDIDMIDAVLFFDIISSEGKQAVDIEGFVFGCMKLRGKARSIDLISVLYNQKKS